MPFQIVLSADAINDIDEVHKSVRPISNKKRTNHIVSEQLFCDFCTLDSFLY